MEPTLIYYMLNMSTGEGNYGKAFPKDRAEKQEHVQGTARSLAEGPNTPSLGGAMGEVDRM